MTKPSDAVEEKIILAAIECIEKYGVQETTNRKIAEIANINSAAINYYFRSKEVLIQRVMERTLANAFDWEDIAKLPGATPQEHCAAIFINLLEGGINYPGVTRAHFYELLTTGNYESLIVKRMNEFVSNLVSDLQQRGIKMPQKDLEYACMQITSSVFFMILSPKLFQGEFGVDLTQPVQKNEFINSLVSQLLK